VGARRSGVIVEAKPEYHRPTSPPSCAEAMCDPVDQRGQDREHLLRAPGPTAERALRADRAPAMARLHAACVAIMRQRVQMASTRRPEHRGQPLLAQLCDLANGGDPLGVEL